jgi:hypothetical protein
MEVNVDWWSASSGLRFPYCDAKWLVAECVGQSYGLILLS